MHTQVGEIDTPRSIFAWCWRRAVPSARLRVTGNGQELRFEPKGSKPKGFEPLSAARRSHKCLRSLARARMRARAGPRRARHAGVGRLGGERPAALRPAGRCSAPPRLGETPPAGRRSERGATGHMQRSKRDAAVHMQGACGISCEGLLAPHTITRTAACCRAAGGSSGAHAPRWACSPFQALHGGPAGWGWWSLA